MSLRKNWPGRQSIPANKTLCALMCNRKAPPALAEAADAPRRTAASAASATAGAAATAATATAAATTATPGHLLHAAALASLLVEEMEGREAHIGNFF